MTQNNKPGNLGALTKLSISTWWWTPKRHQGIVSLSSLIKPNSPLNTEAKWVLNSAKTNLIQSTMKSALDTRNEVTLQKAADRIGLRVAICLDFTASTSNLVQQFKQHSIDIVNGLRNPARSVDILPVAFYGDKSQGDTVSFLASSGEIGNMSWWDSVENITNNRNEPPVVTGLQQVIKKDFFTTDPSVLNVGIIVADEWIVKDSGYEQVVSYLLKTNTLVISMLENNSDSAIQSYEDLLGKLLWEKSTVITNSESPVTLARDFIEYYLREKVKTQGTIPTQAFNQDWIVGFSELSRFLQNRGHHNLLVSQWSGRRLLIGK